MSLQQLFKRINMLNENISLSYHKTFSFLSGSSSCYRVLKKIMVVLMSSKKLLNAGFLMSPSWSWVSVMSRPFCPLRDSISWTINPVGFNGLPLGYLALSGQCWCFCCEVTGSSGWKPLILYKWYRSINLHSLNKMFHFHYPKLKLDQNCHGCIELRFLACLLSF